MFGDKSCLRTHALYRVKLAFGTYPVGYIFKTGPDGISATLRDSWLSMGFLELVPPEENSKPNRERKPSKMKTTIAAVVLILGLASSVNAQQGVIITPSRTYSLDYDGTGSTVMTLSATSSTVVTASTVLVQGIYCNNTTGGAVTVNLTDTAGVSLATAFSIGANSAPTALVNALAGIKMVGIKMWASAVSSINCVITGKF